MARTVSRNKGLRLLFVVAMGMAVLLSAYGSAQAEGGQSNPTALPEGFVDGPLAPFPETLTINMVTGYGPPEEVDKYPSGITPENMPWNDMLLQELNIKINTSSAIRVAATTASLRVMRRGHADSSSTDA